VLQYHIMLLSGVDTICNDTRKALAILAISL